MTALKASSTRLCRSNK